MKYVSTRGKMAPKSFTEVLLMGLAPDGGLAMPESIPLISQNTLLAWQNLSYSDLAFEIFSLYIDDIDATDLKNIINRAYTKDKFGCEDITPLRKLNDKRYILGLSNGPTLAFKDVAMQLIGELFEYVLAKNGQNLNIVGATSGDTGSAAEHAMLGKQNVNVFMLSPHGRMSPFQQAQMFGLDEPNIINISVKGVFDDCQDIVKAINADSGFKKRYKIGAVNSINWARILAQTVYYFKAYFALTKQIKNQENSDKNSDKSLPPISFCVPSGNFGNVYAGFVAKQMGLPINKLIVATNENDVLNEFFKTGIYQVRQSDSVYETSSPSMDIGKASNFERYIYNIFNNDAEQIAKLWESLAENNRFDLSEHYHLLVAKSGLVADKSTHKDRLVAIKEAYEKYANYVDPHTADGLVVADLVADKLHADEIIICLETALPAKFELTMQEALGFVPPRPAKYANIEDLPKKCSVIDNEVNAVKRIIENKVVIN